MAEKIVVITGPTATGKTRLSVELAKKFGGEIVSADSMQIYRGMDIGTAKVTHTEMQGVTHHMIDIADPTEVYSVSRYVEDANKAVQDILAHGRLPIIAGGKEPTTLKELAAVLGKETIDTYNTGENRGRETSHSLNYQKLGKELMSQDELAVMDGGKCILQLRGVRPFLSDKYDITKHPNYPYTADADPKNAFDIEAFLSTRLKLKPNEVYDVYEVDAEGA